MCVSVFIYVMTAPKPCTDHMGSIDDRRDYSTEPCGIYSEGWCGGQMWKGIVVEKLDLVETCGWWVE